jgi:hypothetical protein
MIRVRHISIGLANSLRPGNWAECWGILPLPDIADPACRFRCDVRPTVSPNPPQRGRQPKPSVRPSRAEPGMPRALRVW